MTGYRSSLYPHIVYRRVETGFLMGETNTRGRSAYTFYQGYDLEMKEVSDMAGYIREEIVEKSNYMKAEETGATETFEEACQKTDAIWQIRVVKTAVANPFVKECSYVITKKIRERYESDLPLEEDLPEEIIEAAGIGVESYPIALGPADAKEGDEFLLLQRYQNGKYGMYSEEHFLYAMDSEEAEYIMKLEK